MQGNMINPHKNLAVTKGKTVMYRGKDRNTKYLFEELFPFGGKLNENNRWLRIAEMIPWEELEEDYSKFFSHTGRPGLDSRLIIGLMLLKHLTVLSDKEVVNGMIENPYWQAFCGYEHFITEKMLDASSLTRARKRMGSKYFREMEKKTYKVLIERKIIKGRGMIVDGTVFPEKIKYPNDVGLLNTVREWLVKNIKETGARIGKKYRTYCRKARKTYLDFSKKKLKSRKVVRKGKKQLLQYVRRNMKQVKDVIKRARGAGETIKKKIIEKLKVAEEIYAQQYEMYRENKKRIKDRIVSFHRDYVRPIKRGKSGKHVEFGPKCALSHVGGFLFMDNMSHDNVSEASTEIVTAQLKNYEEKFGKKPEYFTADHLYGTRNNRALLVKEGIRPAFKQLGRKKKGMPKTDQWFKKKQRERNRIEGHFGHGKEHCGLDKIKYQGKDGSEIWIRCGILAMNLKTALART